MMINKKIGLRFKFDFIKKDWTFDYNFLYWGQDKDDVTSRYNTYYIMLLFIGFTLRIGKNPKTL